MKKTLVALAVLAASGASFAQVAVTGNVSMGWAGGQDAAGNQASGLGVDTATLDFGVKEDLGGGMKIEAHQGFDTLSRQTVIGGDTTMALSTSAYTLSLTSTLLADYLVGGIANQASLFNGFEGRLVGSKSSKDAIGVSVPVGPVTLSVTEYEAAGVGLGAGSSGAASATGQRNTQYQIAYAGGPLAANVAFKSYDSNSTPTVNATTTLFGQADAPKSIVRGSVSYDFGVAKVGAGTAVTSLILAGTDTESMISVGVPFGSLFFGAAYMTRNINGSGAGTVPSVDATYNGYGLELDYNFSKTTKLAVNYMNWQQANINTSTASTTTPYSGAYNSNLTEIALSKSF